MLKRFALPTLLLLLVSFTITAANAHACVGRKLVIGSIEADRPGMVNRILSILIHERTGTTVEVKYFPDRGKLLAAVKKHKVNLYVDYVDRAIDRLNIDVSSTDRSEKFKAVKRQFDEELNQVWLKPMGYSGISPDGQALGPASIVVHKDTLKKFPALPRLLEKIGTKVILDDRQLDSLLERSSGLVEVSHLVIGKAKISIRSPRRRQLDGFQCCFQRRFLIAQVILYRTDQQPGPCVVGTQFDDPAEHLQRLVVATAPVQELGVRHPVAPVSGLSLYSRLECHFRSVDIALRYIGLAKTNPYLCSRLIIE